MNMGRQSSLVRHLRTATAVVAIFLTAAAVTVAQQVVVSEYYNDNPPQEWTEILVTQDNVDLRGWVVTDNNASQTSRQGGVRFRNIPYWQHVRAGTIIGIWHRDYLSTSPQDLDTAMADGRVMLAKNDMRFFEPYASPDVQFPDAPMNLAQEGDIMEILDANGNHVHGLGHRTTPGSYWIAMPEPKLNTASALNNGQSNRVFPGSMLSQYNGQHGAPLSEACAVNITRTLPNKSCTSTASNWEFWHSLRRPSWVSPQLQATVNPTSVQLTWNPASDPYPQDGLSGYLIVRDSSGQEFLPEQGRIYRDGERIGSTIILTHLPSTATSYTDPVVLTCGVTYSYRVFAFRFAQDDEYGAYPPPQSTRGRQYNTSVFGAVTALKQVEPGPSLQTNGSPTTFCDGGSITLSVPSIPPGYAAQWLRNGAAINGATSTAYRATTSGEYRLRLQRPDGCFVLSDSVVITVHPTPTATIFPRSRVELCQDSSLLLQSPFIEGWRYQWYRDGTPINGATSAAYLATAAGSYTVEITNEFGCLARAEPTTIEVIRLQLELSQRQVQFPPLSGCESVREFTLTLRNQSSFPVELRRAFEPQHFFLVAPSLPVQLQPGEERSITLRFAPTVTGTWNDSIGIEIQPCGLIGWIAVQGSKSGAAGALSTQTALKDVGVVARCNGVATPRVDSLVITASGDLTVESIRIGAPFRLGSGFPSTFPMRAGQSQTIPIEFAPSLDRPYATDITIAYTSAQCRDSLIIPLRGTLTTPFIALSAHDITFPTLDSCSAIFADTIITLYNTSLAPIEIEQLGDEQVQIVHPTPSPTLTILPKDSLQLRIRYSPNGYTPTAQRLTILFGDQRCTQSEVLVVRGMRVGSTVTVSIATISFTPLLRCRDTTVSSSLWLDVASIPSNTAGVSIASISSTTEWLQSSLVPGMLSDGRHPFTITVDPRRLPLGQSTATLSIRIEPCNRILTVGVTATAEDLELGFAEAALSDTLIVNVGDVPIGSSVTRTATVTNSSAYSLRFASLGQLPSWLELSAPFLPPNMLAAQTSQQATIRITPQQEGAIADTVVFDVLDPCPRRLILIVTGRAIRENVGPAPIALGVIIPETITASPGDQVRFSIRIEGVTRPVVTSRLDLPILFDRSLFAVEQLVPGTALQDGTLTGTSSPDGYRLLITNAAVNQSGPIAYLDGRVLLGAVRETALLPDSARIVTSDSIITIATVQPGWLRLEDRCNLDSRLIRLGSTTQLMLQKDDSQLTILLDQVMSADAQISLFDVSGRVVQSIFRGHLSRGQHVFTIPLARLPQGAFLLLYSSQDITRSMLFVNN